MQPFNNIASIYNVTYLNLRIKLIKTHKSRDFGITRMELHIFYFMIYIFYHFFTILL